MITVMNMITGDVTLDSPASSVREVTPKRDVVHDCPTLALYEVTAAAPLHRTGMPPELANHPVDVFLAEFD